MCLTGCTAPRPAYRTPADLPDTWRTHAERTDYAETGRFDETVALCRRLAAASPYAHYTSIGRSGEGRDLPLLILSRDRAFTPAAARRAGRPVVLIQCCIHAGECAGKDAALALARDVLLTASCAPLLDGVTLLILPIFNADGHERFGPHNRINQNGPRAMGWRTNATNLNLNRDYLKADAPETRAWLRLWTAWQPHLFFDNHSTDGSETQYDLLYLASTNQYAGPAVVTWLDERFLPAILGALAADGYLTLPYAWPRDETDPGRGLVAATTLPPRFSTAYAALCNRPAVLVEMHARKPYRRRVAGNYALFVHALRTVQADPQSLLDAVRAADELCTRTRGGEADGRVPLTLEHAGDGEPITYHACDFTLRPSEIMGGDVITYTDTPRDFETTLLQQTRVATAVTPPAAYLIPPQWGDVIDRVIAHGLTCERLSAERIVTVTSYRFENVTFADRPQEGRQVPRYTLSPVTEQRRFPAGTVVVPLDQPRGKLAVHLLEPEAPDAIVRWGLFNAIFERKEYYEAYVMEPLAREMLALDADLRAAFSARIRTDPEFAADPRRRLDFFYERSPYYDARQNAYPVAGVSIDGLMTLAPDLCPMPEWSP